MESSDVLSSLSMEDCELRADCMPETPVNTVGYPLHQGASHTWIVITLISLWKLNPLLLGRIILNTQIKGCTEIMAMWSVWTNKGQGKNGRENRNDQDLYYNSYKAGLSGKEGTIVLNHNHSKHLKNRLQTFGMGIHYEKKWHVFPHRATITSQDN